MLRKRMPCRAGRVLPSVGGLSTDRIREPFRRTENVSRYFRMVSTKIIHRNSTNSCIQFNWTDSIMRVISTTIQHTKEVSWFLNILYAYDLHSFIFYFLTAVFTMSKRQKRIFLLLALLTCTSSWEQRKGLFPLNVRQQSKRSESSHVEKFWTHAHNGAIFCNLRQYMITVITYIISPWICSNVVGVNSE